VVHLWTCALPGTHGTGDEWSVCTAHAGARWPTCACGGRPPHPSAALGCTNGCGAAQQRANVWWVLPCGFNAVEGKYGAPAAPIASAADFYDLPSELSMNGTTIKLHVRGRPPPTHTHGRSAFELGPSAL